jgi:uncharacterized RDD family membrane protein YckC
MMPRPFVTASAAASPDLPVSATSPSIRRRLAAMFYESLLLLGVLSFAFFLPQLLLALIRHVAAPGWLMLLHFFLVPLAYFFWFWRKSGQTLAMQTWKIRLVGADGASKVTAAQAILRYLLAWPSLLLFGAGILWALIDRERQFLHDRLAGTRLVRA